MTEAETINRGWTRSGRHYHKVAALRLEPIAYMLCTWMDATGWLLNGYGRPTKDILPKGLLPCKRCFPKGDTA